MASIQDIINEAYILNGDRGYGEAPTGAETEYALSIINEIFEEFSLHKLLAFATTRLAFPLIANQQSYTIGTGGNFNVDRPVDIKAASILYLDVETPLEIESLGQWQDIDLKTIGGLSYTLYMDNAFPLNNLYLYPVPIDNTTQLILYVSTPFSEILIDNIALNIAFPKGYKKAIKYVLAYELSVSSKKADDRIEQIAEESKQLLKSNNENKSVLKTPFDNHVFNYYRGW